MVARVESHRERKLTATGVVDRASKPFSPGAALWGAPCSDVVKALSGPLGYGKAFKAESSRVVRLEYTRVTTCFSAGTELEELGSGGLELS